MVEAKAARPSTTGRITVCIGILLFAHAAYSTYEILSQGKSLDQGTASTKYETSAIPWDVTLETLFAFAVLAAGCALTTPLLREIAWTTELSADTNDRIQARPNFANVHHRGSKLFGTIES